MQQEKNKVEKKGKVYESTDPDAVPSDEATMMSDALMLHILHTLPMTEIILT